MSDWVIDAARSKVGFSVRHMVVSKVRGRFARFSGRIALDETDVTRSRVEARIDVTSVETGDRERDEYLRTADFLDPARHPEIAFTSTRIERAGRERLRLVGDLTIRGVTRAVTLDVAPRGGSGARRAFAATAAIDRKDFQLHWNALVEAGGFMVGDKLEIALEVEATPC